MRDEEQWVRKKLGDIDVSKIIMGQSPSSAAYNEEGVGLPFLQGCAEFGDVYPNTSIFCSDILKIAPENSILMSVRAPVGTINKADQKYVIGRGLCSIVPMIDGEYLYYYLLQNTHELELKAQGSTFLAINSTELNDMPICYPDSPHAQRRIAAILSAADKVIEQTRQLIGKYKSIKQGMMEDLLKPREGWKKVKLGEVGTFKNGINKDKSQFGFGILYVSISDAYFENIDFKKLNRLNATEKEIEEYLLVDDDIVFVRSSVKPSGVGYTTLFRHYEKEPVLFSGFMIRYRLNDKVNNSAEFLNYLFRSEEFRRQVIGKSTVSANTNVNQESLKELVCFIPDFPEQRRIAKILSGIDRKIEAEEKVLEKYEKMKKGLMERLLGEKHK